ncbi:DNA internalization-related competence protein ComEC/Rec2 [Mycetohabitans rhizoxinica]|nr:DNA internalization-related competence protein ComEC/Rec2 [Mycetohabitans rhizoxinica]
MMLARLCAFVVGTGVLQWQPSLPDTAGWLVWGAAAFAAAGVACIAYRARAAGRVNWPTSWLARAASIGCAALLGFGYAAWRAHSALSDALPPQWEGRDVTLTGTVRGLPSRDARGLRFLFDVEATSPRIERFPRTVQLSWLAAFGRQPSATLVPGGRHTLVARLKRVHGNGNFRLPDTDVRQLARGVRAQGYVRHLQADPRGQPGTSLSSPRAPDIERGPSIRAMLNAVDRRRAAIRTRIEQVLSESARTGTGSGSDEAARSHAGIVIALAIGVQDAITEPDWERLRRTGTNHLMAISGLHIGSVAALAAAIIALAWRRGFGVAPALPLHVPVPIACCVGAMLAGAGYAALAGLGIPAQRTVAMLSIATLAYASGRRVDPLLALAWALVIVVLVDPWATLSASTALSFGAVAAIVVALRCVGRNQSQRDDEPDWPSLDPADALPQAGAGRPGERPAGMPGPQPASTCVPRSAKAFGALVARMRAAVRGMPTRLASAMRVQWAVTLGLAPLTVVWFSQIPALGPVANAIAIPWVSTLVVPAVLLAIAIPAPFDALLLQWAHRLVQWLFAILDALAEPAWGVWYLPAPEPAALLLALVGAAWMLGPRGWPLRAAAPILWLPLLWPASRAPLADGFRVTALDIGQGTAVLVETAQRRLLFDAGPGPEAGNAGQRIVVPFLRAHDVNALDMLVVSHRDVDHAGGVPAVLADMPIAQMQASLPPAHPLWARATARGAITRACRAGERWRWDGVTFEFLWPAGAADPRKPNATACVLRVSNALGAVLIASDIERAAERALVERHGPALSSDVLIVPHHGSKTSSTDVFIDSVRPRMAVFQVGYRNRFGHPHPLVTARYRVRGVDMLRSDDDGAVRIDSGVSGWMVDAYRRSRRRYWTGR